MPSVRGLRPTATRSSSRLELSLPLELHRRSPPSAAGDRRRLGAGVDVDSGLAQRVGDLLAGERLLVREHAVPPSTSVTSVPRRRQAWASSEPDRAAAEDDQAPRDLLRRWSPRGCSRASPRSRPSIGGIAAELPVAITTALRARQVVVADPDPPLAVERPSPRKSSMPFSSSQGSCDESSRSWITSSRRARIACGSSSPPTASAAPGTRRASASTSAGRSSAFEGMHA